jgi:hypothetical protein
MGATTTCSLNEMHSSQNHSKVGDNEERTKEKIVENDVSSTYMPVYDRG